MKARGCAIGKVARQGKTHPLPSGPSVVYGFVGCMATAGSLRRQIEARKTFFFFHTPLPPFTHRVVVVRVWWWCLLLLLLLLLPFLLMAGMAGLPVGGKIGRRSAVRHGVPSPT